MSVWKACIVQDLVDSGEAEVKTGPFGTQLHASDYVDFGIPVINVRNIGFGGIRPEKLEYISEETAQRLSTHILKTKDIVFGRKGAVERHVLIKNDQNRWFQGSDCIRLRLTGNSADPSYVSYSFLSEDHKAWMMNQCSHGATMASLNQDIVKRIPLLLPPLETQLKIATILSVYDDLIENNTRRIKILEEMARMIYREWFVNVRFPGHEKVKMVDSPLGRIPYGWEVLKFTDIAEVLSGGTPKTSVEEYWDGSIPFFAPKDAPSQYYVTNTEKSITEAGLKKCNSKLYPKETVFITARGTVGKVVMPADDMAMNQSCYALVGKGGVTQPFLFLLTLQCVDYLKKNTGGATFDTIVVDTFRGLEVLRPPTKLIEMMTLKVRPILDLCLNLIMKNQNLCQTRDLLLPKLISGEVEACNLSRIGMPEVA